MSRTVPALAALVALRLFAAAASGEAMETLVWRDCVGQAKMRNPDLSSALAKITQARATRSIAASPLFPQVTANMNDTRADSSAAGIGEEHNYSLAGKQLFFDGFKTPFEMGKAGEGINSSLYGYRVTSSDVRLALRKAFIQLMRAQELLVIATEIAARRKQNMELVRLRYEAGREHRGSLMLSEADYAQAQYQINQAQRGIVLGQRSLNLAIGWTRFTPVRAVEQVSLKPPARQRPDFERMAERNPFLRQLIAQKEAARWGVKSAKADYFPQVYGNMTAGRSDTAWPPHNNDWILSMNLTWPLFEGRRRVSEVARTQGVLSQAEADEWSGRDSVILTMAQTWTLLQDARDEAIVQQMYVSAAEERAKITRALYTTGLAQFDSWTIIEDSLVSARQKFLNALAASEAAEADWVQAQGLTLEDETP